VGEFVAVSAFRCAGPEQALDGVRGFLAAHGFGASEVPAGAAVDGDHDVLAYPSPGGWVVLLWPRYWASPPASVHVSAQLGTVGSAVTIVGGDYWTHTLLRDGEILDRFASMPDYDTDDPAEIVRRSARYAGDAARVAEVLDCPADQVSPYLVHAMATEHADKRAPDILLDHADPGPAFPDDEYERDNPWVFVDFWRRIGIAYPDDVSAFAGRLRLGPGWSGALPSGDAEL
jgi:hypothetical protein